MLPYLPTGALLPGLTLGWANVAPPTGWTANPTPGPGDYQFRSPDGLLVTVEEVSGASMSLADRVIDYTARKESYGRYENVVPDDNGKGMAYGLLSFNQRVGELPALFVAMQRESPEKFARYLGTDGANFLNENWVRHADLLPYTTALKVMAGEPEFQRAQRMVAKEKFYDRAEKRARRYGLTSERAITAIFDAGVQRGFGNVDKALSLAARPGVPVKDALAQFAVLIDENPLSQGRRTDILRDRSLADNGQSDTGEWARLRVRRKTGLTGQDVEVARALTVPQGTVLTTFQTSSTDAEVWVKVA